MGESKDYGGGEERGNKIRWVQVGKRRGENEQYELFITRNNYISRKLTNSPTQTG